MTLTLAPLTNFDVGAIAAATIAFVSFRIRALDGGGALAAVAVGTAIYGGLGWPGAFVLLTFFVSANALSRVGRGQKRLLRAELGKRGSRDATQVFANGSVAAAGAILALGGDHRYAFAFAGALAAATADTWGTEFGTLAREAPRSILSGRPMAAGLSGGVTTAGLLAELAGALAIAVASLALTLQAFVPVAVAGVVGALLDSVLGASVQALRWCPQCRRPTEREPHSCGANTERIRGASFIDNDVVNFAATLAGAVVAFALAP